jgi:hypothetical protein
MGFKKRSFGRRISQFLSKMFWQFNQQPTARYSCNDRNGLLTSTSKRSINKYGLNVSYQRTPSARNNIRNQYPARYRTCSMRKRTSTLTSIKEE